MDTFTHAIIAACASGATNIAAWCVLPNHYHLLLETGALAKLTRGLGLLHGRSSRAWNLEEGTVGRKVFHRSVDRHIRSERHFGLR